MGPGLAHKSEYIHERRLRRMIFTRCPRHILPRVPYMFSSGTVSFIFMFCCASLTRQTADLDNAYWGGDQNIPTFRPSYQINDTHPGTDAAAGASAAFSACSNLYSNRTFGGPFSPPASLQNSSYGEKLRVHAQQLYTFAVNATGGQKTYQTSVPVVADAYGSSSFTDELTLAALLLSWATNSTSLYQQAEDHYKNFKLGDQNGVFNWDSKTPGLAVLFAQIAQSPTSLGGKLDSWQSEAERYFDRIINSQGPGYLTKGTLSALSILFYEALNVYRRPSVL